jgi:hypothetical protein
VISEKKEITYVDDWDPVNMELRQYRVLQSEKAKEVWDR